MGEKIATGYIYRLKTKRGHVSMFGWRQNNFYDHLLCRFKLVNMASNV